MPPSDSAHVFFLPQSSLVAQLVLHAPAVASQANGAHDDIGPAMHFPFMHVAAPLMLPLLPSHDAAAQAVPSGYVVQAPAPLQTPVVPQLEAGIALHCPAGSAPPLGTGLQVPCFPSTAHELQLPQLDDPQQTPSVQWPLAQVLSAVHAVPLGERLLQVPD